MSHFQLSVRDKQLIAFIENITNTSNNISEIRNDIFYKRFFEILINDRHCELFDQFENIHLQFLINFRNSIKSIKKSQKFSTSICYSLFDDNYDLIAHYCSVFDLFAYVSKHGVMLSYDYPVSYNMCHIKYHILNGYHDIPTYLLDPSFEKYGICLLRPINKGDIFLKANEWYVYNGVKCKKL